MDCGPDGAVVFGDCGSVRLPRELWRRGEGWSPLARIGSTEPGDSAGMVLDHLSPYRDFRSLRDPGEMPGADLRAWDGLVRDTSDLLRREHPVAHRMVTRTIRTLVPVEGQSPLRAVSASVPDAYGAVTVSRASDASAFAATLIHEARHQILTALADLVPLFTPVRQGPELAYFAPWREDARPLRGLLYGAHAFAGVASYWRDRRALDGERADFEFALHRWQLQVALGSLRNATGLTEVGGRVVAAIAESARDWWAEPVFGPPGQLAEMCCRDQWATWRAVNLAVEVSEADELAGKWLAGSSPPPCLPAARAAVPRTHVPGGGARTWLARLWFSDREAFGQVRAALDCGTLNPLGITGATPADAAVVADDTKDALVGYRKSAPGVDSWIGIGLADARAAMLVERPELVLALHMALLRRGVEPPGPEELAEWLRL